jgi:hypothetical protein
VTENQEMMRRGDWVRLTVYMVTTNVRARDLRTLARKSSVLSVMEGWLLCHITLGGRIDLVVRVKGGELCHGHLMIEPISRIEAPHVATRWELYTFAKVPPPSDESFRDFA